MATQAPDEGPRKDEDSLLNALIRESEARRDRTGEEETPEDPWEALWHDITQVDRLREMLAGDPARAPGAGEEAELPRTIGRFAIIERIGTGGFGIVYRARDPRLDRDVALKVPHPGRAPSHEIRQRFLREARAAAGLDHPNIVHVLEMGVDDSQLYIASTYCEGPNLAQWIAARAEPFPPRQAARLIQTLAGAIAHAHGRQVYHRDIKPSNILLQLAEGPDRGGPGADEGEARGDDSPRRLLARIVDFGLARIASESMDLTGSQGALGTPPYMAPEQVSKERQPPGPGPDIYGLGATLYEMLTARPPFQGPSPDVVLLQVVADDPIPPRKINPKVPRDLESICLKCLEKDPKRRYPTAKALESDLGRFLDGDRVEARPRSSWYYARRWSRRHAALASVLFLFLPTLLLASLSAWIMDGRLRARARELSDQTRLLNWGAALARIRRASQSLDNHHIEEAQDILDEIGPIPSGEDPRGFAWALLQREARRAFAQVRVDAIISHRIALSRDERTLACGAGENPPIPNQLLILDYPGGKVRSRIADPRLQFGILAVANGARWAATTQTGRPAILLWDADAKAIAREWTFEGEEPRQAGFFGDGRIAATVHATGGEDVLRLWDLAAAREGGEWPRLIRQCRGLSRVSCGAGRIVAIDAERRLLEIDPATGKSRLLGPSLPAGAANLVISADDRSLVASEPGRGLVALDLEGRMDPARIEFAKPITGLAISPRGAAVAAADPEGFATIWEPKSGQTRVIRLRDQELDRDPGFVPQITLQFSPDEARLATSFNNRPNEAARLWDVAAARLSAKLPGRIEFAQSLLFTTDGGSLLVSGSPPIRRWKMGPPPFPQLLGHSDEIWALAFSPDSRTLISAGNDTKEPHTIKAWDVDTGELLLGWKAHTATVAALAFHPDGGSFVSGSLDGRGRLFRWEPRTGRALGELGGEVGITRALAYSPDGKALASAGSDQLVRLWDHAEGRIRRTYDVPRNKIRAVAFSPDGTLLAAASEDTFVRIWDPSAPDPVGVVKMAEKVTALAFHPDGRLIAADHRGVITILDPKTGRTLHHLRGEGLEVNSLALHPDGKTLAVAGMRSVIRLWDLETGQDLLDLKGHATRVNTLAFSPDGRVLASADHQGAIRLWWGAPLSPDE